MNGPAIASAARVRPQTMGVARPRADAVEKLTGRATYGIENAPSDALHAWLVLATTPRARIVAIRTEEALAHPGVVSVLDHTNAPRLADTSNGELAILQDPQIHYRGQIVAVVLAETSEAAREGAALVRVRHDVEEHQVEFLESAATYRPAVVNPDFPTDTEDGDVDAALAAADLSVSETYRTAHESNNPMEPHQLVAQWTADRRSGEAVLTLHDSTQGVHAAASALAPALGLETQQVRVVAAYVGGGFGSKGEPHSHEMAAALAARTTEGRAVRLAVTRQQMFAMTGYRTATISHVTLGARDDGALTGLEHRVVEQTSRVREFAEQTAVPARMMYAAPARRTSHRLAQLDVTVPSWMRAPGEMPGMFAQEMAMEDLAIEAGFDPLELRRRNDTATDPETGLPFNNRRLVDCLDRGAQAFGWSARTPRARATLDGNWWVGQGVASATYPMSRAPGNQACVRSLAGGRYEVATGAVDIGTGARTVLAQIAADALDVPVEVIDLQIADTLLPSASVAGGSTGTSSWGTAVVAAAQRFRDVHGDHPEPGLGITASATDPTAGQTHSMHSFGAVFCEARVHRLTGEIRVPRLLGVYSVGRVVNPTTAHSQFVGGLIMGMSAALFEESWRDPRFGHFVTQDLASYHIATHADVQTIEAEWLDEEDQLANPMGSRGIGEIGIVGTSAAVANATYHATGIRIREIPITPDRLLG